MAFTFEEVDDVLDPVAGDPILGVLEHDLKVQYCELIDIENELADLSDELRKSVIGEVAKHLQEWDGSPNQEMLVQLGDVSSFGSEDDAFSYFELVARWNEANASFWYRAKLTYAAFNHTCEIRRGFTVVSLGKKYSK